MTKRFNKSFRRCPGYDEERLGVASRAWCLPGVSVWLVVPAGRPATRCQPCLPALVPGLYFFALCPDFPFKVLPFVCPVFSLSFPILSIYIYSHIFLIPFLFFFNPFALCFAEDQPSFPCFAFVSSMFPSSAFSIDLHGFPNPPPLPHTRLPSPLCHRVLLAYLEALLNFLCSPCSSFP